LLLKFFSRPGVRAHLRGLAEELCESTNSVRLELNKLEQVGLLKKEAEGQKIVYFVDVQNTFHTELVKLVSKYLGFDQMIVDLSSMSSEIEKIYVVGDYARGIDGGLIQVVIVGNIHADEIYPKLKTIETRVGRKIELILLKTELNVSNFDNILQLV